MKKDTLDKTEHMVKCRKLNIILTLRRLTVDLKKKSQSSVNYISAEWANPTQQYSQIVLMLVSTLNYSNKVQYLAAICFHKRTHTHAHACTRTHEHKHTHKQSSFENNIPYRN